MIEQNLRNCRILVVEDEYVVADELATELNEAGAVVLGPVGTLEGAIGMIAAEARIDGAVLDVSVGGNMIFPAADLLLERNVPFVFATGYDASSIPLRFGHVTRCEKPVDMRRVTQTIGQAIRTQAQGA